MRKTLLSVLAIILLGGALIAAFFIANKEKEKPEKVDKAIKTVFVATAKNDTVFIIIPANGNLVAQNRLELYAEVQGVFRNSAHAFKAGQRYKRGQLLLNLDAQEYQATVQAAKSELYNLVASTMPDLRLDYTDIFDKWQSYLDGFDMTRGTPKLPETASEKEKYFITGRGIYSAYYNVKNLEQRLGKYRISAPFNGILTEALVTNGTLVRTGQKLGEFIDTSIYELEVSLGKKFSDLLKIGEQVTLNDLNGNDSYTGKVVRINGRVDQATQTIKVFIEVKNEGDLKEGMYLEARLEARDEPSAIEIPRKLLVDNSKMFIVRDSILDLIEVEPVYFSDTEAVVKGLEDGTKYVSKPIPGAYAGMLVKVVDDKEEEANANKNDI